MPSIFDIDWQSMFVPTIGLLELVVRGSVIYLALLAALRIFRREAGALSMADLLVVVVIADAAQNAMSSEYNSITEGLVLVSTIIGWNYLLDWLDFRYPWAHRLLHAPPLLLVKDGRVQRRNMRAELLTMSDLAEQLREQGLESVSQVKRCYLESDGRLSVIKYDNGEREASSSKREQGIA